MSSSKNKTLLERTVVSFLLKNEDFARGIISKIHPDEHLAVTEHREIAGILRRSLMKSNTFPTKDMIVVDLSEKARSTLAMLYEIDAGSDQAWAMERLQDLAKHNATMAALSKAIAMKEEGSFNDIPHILEKAIATDMYDRPDYRAHDESLEASAVLDSYGRQNGLKFLNKTLNSLYNGPIPKKTLHLVLGGTNVGKTLSLINFASEYYMQGYFVAYASLEMSEAEIMKRFDAITLGFSVDDLSERKVKAAEYHKKRAAMRSTTKGELFVKQFANGTADSLTFKSMIEELERKHRRRVDVLIVDYLGIMSGSGETYAKHKMNAESLRSLAIQKDLLVWSAGQLKRSHEIPPTQDDVAESIAMLHPVDSAVAIYTTNELIENGLFGLSVVKTRFARRRSTNEELYIGIDPESMQMYPVSEGVMSKAADKPVATVGNNESPEQKKDVPW